MNGRLASALLVGGVVAAMTAGVSLSPPTATYSAVVRLAGTTIGVGPSFEPSGLTLPFLFYGTAVPEGDSFHTVPYPAQMTVEIPIISELPVLSDLPYWPHSLKRSEQIGAGYLLEDIAATPADQKVTIIGVSQGTMVAEVARAAMNDGSNYLANADNYQFVLIGDPYQPNGGLLTRFTYLKDAPILGDLFPIGRPGPTDTAFKTTYYQNQYDAVTDFPEYFNPLALANIAAGSFFGHVFPGYVLESPTDANVVTTTVGNTTYVFFPHYLSLLQPLRLAASVVGAERFVDAVDPVLRVFVEMGYDRTADPSQVKEFSLVTPPKKFEEAAEELPGAFAQSAAILGGEHYVPTAPQPVVDPDAAPSPWTEHPADAVDHSPIAEHVRTAVDNAAQSLSKATRPLAKILNGFGGQTSTAQKQAKPGAAAVKILVKHVSADLAKLKKRLTKLSKDLPKAKSDGKN